MKLSKHLRARLLPATLLALGLVAAGRTASAQCPLPDNLDGGPCCAPTVENVGYFKKIAQPSLSICWRDCGVAATAPVRAVWSPLHILPSTGADCSYRTSRLDLFDPVGTLLWSGVMRLLYSRTWMEAGPAGSPLQVWRFLVNGDLRPTAAVGPAPCPLPPCAPAFNNRVRFTGYIDYAVDCGIAANPVSIAWMLTHACDPIDHAPGFPRAGAFHPGISYTFVGPGAGFVVAPVVAAEGTPGSGLEAVRRLIHPPLGAVGPITCEFEERAGHALPTTSFCFCSLAPPLNPQWVFGSLTVGGACGTSVTTPGGPFLPGYLSMSIGSWTAPGAYPGPEDLRWNVGNYSYTEGCTGLVRPEVFFGVTTIGGFPASSVPAGGPVVIYPPVFIDQANSIRAGGAPLMNTPFVSDHILNLNH